VDQERWLLRVGRWLLICWAVLQTVHHFNIGEHGLLPVLAGDPVVGPLEELQLVNDLELELWVIERQ